MVPVVFLMHIQFCQSVYTNIQAKQLMGDVMKEASFSLAEAKFTGGDFSHTVLQNVTRAQIKVRTKKENVAGEDFFQPILNKVDGN